MAVQTTFSMFQQLLKNAISNDSTLDSVMKAALTARVDALPKVERSALTSRNVSQVTGATVNEATDSITVANGDNAEITWNLITFLTPVRIDGTITLLGALEGHGGNGVNALVAEADITLQYRLSTSAAWRAFGRNVVIDSVTTIQFKAIIATQTNDCDVPQLHVISEQL